MFAALGRWCFERRRIVLAAWLVAIFGVFFAVNQVGPGFDGGTNIPNSETRDGADALETYFGGLGAGQSGSIVFRTETDVNDPAVVGPVQEFLAGVAEIEGVTIESPYEGFGPLAQVANEGELAGRVAFANVVLDADIDQSESSKVGEEIRGLRDEAGFASTTEAIDAADAAELAHADIVALVGGGALGEFEPPESELIGVAFAVIVLILAFGSVLAMGLPIGVALSGVGVGLATITLLSSIITMPDFSTTIGAMIGLGVGIDYALFIVTRYRESLHRGNSPLEATVEAIDTAGRSVIFAGVTVVVSLLGMLVMGLAFITGLGVGAAVTVAVTMVASVTLLPALLGFAGERVEVTRYRGLISAGFASLGILGVGLKLPLLMIGLPLALVVLVLGSLVPAMRRPLPPRRQKPNEETFAYRWSRMVQRRPWVAAVGGTLLLLALTVPVLGMRLGFSDEGNARPETDTRQAYETVSEAFGPGFNAPFILTLERADGLELGALANLTQTLSDHPGVASVSPPFPNNPENPQAAVVRIIPTTSPQDAETTALVRELRSGPIPDALDGSGIEPNLTGQVAASVDFTDYLSNRMPIFFTAVLLLSFVLLMVVFRSLLVPLKAVVMNLLSIGAAYGLVVAVFQWGWGASLLGVTPGAPIEPFLPMMMFAIVFGLSMDYEVFLLSRVKEEFDRTGDPVGSVADGLAMTARVITAAAAIMVVVFGSFMFEDDRIVKLFGLGLASAVFLDATIVRMLLVPATMELLGARNWWLPDWLDRLLPNVDVEGTHRHPEVASESPAGASGEPSHAGGVPSVSGGPAANGAGGRGREGDASKVLQGR